MGNNIDNNYIDNAIDELVNLLGVKEEIPREILHKPFRAGNIKGCIRNIANYLGLPIAINLSYVPAKYEPRSYSNKFESADLAKTNHTGRGIESITAQVSIPSYLPLYGTSELQDFPIAVKISDNCLEHPETFMAIMAHELSHILLHSLWHKEKDNEVYTDLTAMILGFSKVMEIGRKVEETKNYVILTQTSTTTYGYLSDKQFYFASNKISGIQKKNINLKKKLLKKLTTSRKQLCSYKKELFRFKKFVEYLDKNPNKAIRKEDIPEIVLFHQLDYTDKFTEVIRSNEKKLKEINDFCVGLIHYTQQVSNSLRKFDEGIDTLIAELKSNLDLVNNDVSILRKYVGFIYKLKLAQLSNSYFK